jgi:uncharacterized protein YprB with RNaseH-like and TPR domain
MDHVPDDDPESWRVLLAPAPAPSLDSDRTRTLFIDLETTGLAGGAGTYAFLVGCGWFEACAFRVQQFLMTSHLAEPLMLEAVAEIAATAGLVVSFNGKAFDLPLIETRFLFNRKETPFEGIPHLDMLHAARRLWRADERPDGSEGCSLGALERSICGHEREGDVAGSEVPSRYFRFVRTGDARPLSNVIEHNRLDLLSLAILTSRAAGLVHDGPRSLRTAREAVGLGRMYERAGMRRRAIACYACATALDEAGGLPGDETTRVDGLRAYARLARRERAFKDAAAAWRLLLAVPGCDPRVMREAAEALAVHCEHRLRDAGAAREFAMRSLPLSTTAARPTDGAALLRRSTCTFGRTVCSCGSRRCRQACRLSRPGPANASGCSKPTTGMPESRTRWQEVSPRPR